MNSRSPSDSSVPGTLLQDLASWVLAWNFALHHAVITALDFSGDPFAHVNSALYITVRYNPDGPRKGRLFDYQTHRVVSLDVRAGFHSPTKQRLESERAYLEATLPETTFYGVASLLITVNPPAAGEFPSVTVAVPSTIYRREALDRMQGDWSATRLEVVMRRYALAPVAAFDRH